MTNDSQRHGIIPIFIYLCNSNNISSHFMNSVSSSLNNLTDSSDTAEKTPWKWSRKKIAAYYLLGVFVFFVWYQLFFNLMYEGSLLGDFKWINIIMSLGFSYLPILLLFILNTGFIFFLSPKILKRESSKPGLKILVDFLLSWTAVAVVNGLFITFSIICGQKPLVMWIPSIVINILVFMINEVLYFVLNYRHTEHKFERERRVSAQLEYNILRSQVNPHFLFNSLNILYSLSHLDVGKSQEFILSLSRMYRYIMAHHNQQSVTLAEELEFLHSYVEVMSTIYNGALYVDIDMFTETENRRIIPYSMQLLMENVIKHNVISEEEPMSVVISITDSGITFTNMVRPRKTKKKPEDNTGIGMKYLSELYALNGKTCKTERTDEKFTVTIPYLN